LSERQAAQFSDFIEAGLAGFVSVSPFGFGVG
jgi:hypothetical protein